MGIEEPCHPEHIRSSFKTPVPKLAVSFQKFGVPESKRGRLPGDLQSDTMVKVIQWVKVIPWFFVHKVDEKPLKLGENVR